MSFYNVKEHVLPAAHIREYPRALANSQEDVLVLHVKEYTPKDNPNPQHGDITIIGGHANGFPKELYEPLWDEIYLEMKRQGIRIRSVFMADVAWQGQSGLLNADKLGNDPSWFDAARDTTHLINTLRPPRPLVAVGHSFGGNILLNVSLSNPRLFTTIVLLDPVITKFSSNPGPLSESPAVMSTYRRDRWPSREEAAAGFRRSPFYRAWDERVLERWVKYGLKEVEEGGKEVELVTTKHQEVFTFLRPSWPGYDPNTKKIFNRAATPDLDTSLSPKFNVHPLYRPEPSLTFHRLPHVRPGVLYLFGGSSNLSPVELRNEKLECTGVGVGGSGGAAEGRVRGAVNEKAGHLVAQEVPKWCAAEMGGWVKDEIDRWWAQEREWQAWTARPHVEKVTISEEYKRHVGKPARPGKPKDKEVKAKI